MWTLVKDCWKAILPTGNKEHEVNIEIIYGLEVLSKRLLGYRYVPWGSGWDDWHAVYEVNTRQGVKYLAMKYDGWVGYGWYPIQPEITHQEPPTWFPKDPWTELGIK